MEKVDQGTYEVLRIDESYEYREAKLAVRFVNSEDVVKWYWKFANTFEPAYSQPDELEKLYRSKC